MSNISHVQQQKLLSHNDKDSSWHTKAHKRIHNSTNTVSVMNIKKIGMVFEER